MYSITIVGDVEGLHEEIACLSKQRHCILNKVRYSRKRGKK